MGQHAHPFKPIHHQDQHDHYMVRCLCTYNGGNWCLKGVLIKSVIHVHFKIITSLLPWKDNSTLHLSTRGEYFSTLCSAVLQSVMGTKIFRTWCQTLLVQILTPNSNLKLIFVILMYICTTSDPILYRPKHWGGNFHGFYSITNALP